MFCTFMNVYKPMWLQKMNWYDTWHHCALSMLATWRMLRPVLLDRRLTDRDGSWASSTSSSLTSRNVYQCRAIPRIGLTVRQLPTAILRYS